MAVKDKEEMEHRQLMLTAYKALVDSEKREEIEKHLIEDIFKSQGIPATESYAEAVFAGYKMAETIRQMNPGKVGFGASTLIHLIHTLEQKKAMAKLPEELKDLD